MGMRHIIAISLVLMGFLLDFTNGECKPADFECSNGRCINMGWKCDGTDDCHDNSDEAGCPAITCTEGYFRCDSGQCIPERWLCDESTDCGDDSDEKAEYCQNKTCAGYKCKNSGTCIPEGWKCDGQADCAEGDDEKECATSCDSKTEFECKNKQCISLQWLCDLHFDCEDKSDEDNCPARKCDTSEWQCLNAECINELWKCDGDVDCSDGSDEAACPVTNLTCESSQFQCHSPLKDPQCIHLSWECDGEEDCTDGSDEAGCDPITCPEGERMCAQNYCIKEDFFCDGQNDCTDGSDELGCNNTAKECGINMFDCNGDGSLCIADTLKCNEINDCGNFADESPAICASHSCQVNNGNCSDICVPSQEDPTGRRCECHPGYQLVKGSKLECEDIDECKQPGKCSQLCHNMKGSFRCDCENGYVLSNKRYCKAVNADSAELFLSDNYDLRRYKLDTFHYTLLLDSEVSGAVAMDFDIRTNMVYWTDTNVKAVSTVNLTTFNRSTILNNQVDTPDGLAVDWIHKNLYISDTGLNVIMVTSLDGKNRKTLVSGDLDEPRALVVDPYKGWMYWTDWGKVAKIEKCGMNGKSRKTIVSDEAQVQWPNGLTIDYVGRRLYWVDAKLHIIGSTDLDGNDFRLILKDHRNLGHPFAITVFEDYLFWTDWMDNAVHKYGKFGSKDEKVKTIALNLKTPMDIRIYHIYRQPSVVNHCGNNNGGCSHLCLPQPQVQITGVKMFECACPDGMTLQTKYICIVDTNAPTQPTPGSTTQNPDSKPNRPKTPKPSPTLRPVIVPVTVETTAKPAEVTSEVPYSIHTSQKPATETSEKPVTAKANNGSEFDHKDEYEHYGHIAIITVAIVLGIVIIVGVIIFLFVRHYKKKNVKSMNFDNPVYRKTTTEDHLIMDRNSSANLPQSQQPLNQDPEIV